MKHKDIIKIIKYISCIYVNILHSPKKLWGMCYMATSICSDLGKSQRNQSNRRKGCKSEVSRVQLDRLELLLRHAQILSYGNIFSIDWHNCISHIHLMRQFVAKLRRWKKSPWKIGGLIRKFLAKIWGSDSDGTLRIVSGLIHVCAKRESIRSPGNYYWPQAIDEYVSWIHFSW